MIDVHCHLNFKAFAKDYDEVIKRAKAAGVATIINVGTKLDTSRKAIELAEKYKNLYAIVGVHPHHADKLELGSNWLSKLEQIAKHPKVVAIGEIGLDNYRYQSNGITDPIAQKELFEAQILLAHKLKLPLQIHNRHAGKEIIEILTYYKSYLLNPPGMFHCFAGSIDILKSALQMGFYIGFDGNITYPGLAPGEDTALPDLVKATPLERILVETDSPYLTPEPHRGSRNEPQYAILVGQKIAEIKAVPISQVDEITTKNVHTLFAL